VSDVTSSPGGDSASVDQDAVAIVGIGCRYADARGPEEFWDIVREGRNTVRDAPDHRIELGYDIDHFYDPRPRIPGKISSKKGGFLEHPELFDPAAFGIAPRDALTMEPQQRLMVEVTWDALEDAGIVPEEIAGERVAVILGYMAEDYSRERAGVLGEAAVYRGHDVFTVGGMSHAVLSGRIAFLLGVTGPSFTLDTACSSSLIATHLACESLRRGESNMALAGGVNLFLSPEGNIALSRSGMLSMSGACKAFDASADGFVRAEGAGVVVLKRLADAVEANDPIYAVIRGTGISSDGRDGGHMMAPGRNGQSQAMRDAYAQAAQSGISPADIQYVETHGTGTMIGDPVEIAALADVMGPGRDEASPLRVASVKGNLGHTESASGIAGLIKTCLAMRHRWLPAQLHFETPNPMIPWDDVPVRVQAESGPWPSTDRMLAGVNSFGISGTNAHVVLEEPPRTELPSTAATTRRRPIVLPISAHEPRALRDNVLVLREALDDLSTNGASLEDFVYTASCRRSHRAQRLSVAGDSLDELATALDAYLAGEPTPETRMGSARPDQAREIVMVFPGQGGQWLGMGRELLESEPAFASMIDRLGSAYARHVDWSLADALRGEAGFDWNDRLDVLQPVLVAIEIALAELWSSWGVRPTRVIGQSMGEIAAAYVAGALDLETVALLACHRGKIVAQASGSGGMAVVSLSREEVEARLVGRETVLEIAGVNSPRTTIVSGDRAPLESWIAGLDADGVFARTLEVDFASHCFHMDPLCEPFRSAIASIRPGTTTIPFHSTVDGEIREGSSLDAGYWVRNLREAVSFDRGFEGVLAEGAEIVLEVSPHPSMPRAVEEIAKAAGKPVAYVPSLIRDQGESISLAAHFGALFVAGAAIDFERYAETGNVTRLPLYPYQRERYWFSERTRLDRFRPTHPLLGRPTDSSLDPATRSWDFVYDVDSAGFVADLKRSGSSEASAGLFLELIQAACASTWPQEAPTLRGLVCHRPLVLREGERRDVQVVLRRATGLRGEVRVSSRTSLDDGDRWQLHAFCEVDCEPAAFRLGSRSGERAPYAEQGVETVEVGVEMIDRGRFDRAMAASDLVVGSRARTLREIALEHRDGRSPAVIGKLMLPRSVEAEWHAYHAHPALVEGALQLASLLLPIPTGVGIESIESSHFDRGLGSDCLCRVSLRLDQEDQAGGTVGLDSHRADYRFFDREGEEVGSLLGVALNPLSSAQSIASPEAPLQLVWSPRMQAPSACAPRIERFVIVSDDEAEASWLASELTKRGASSRVCEKVEDLPRLIAVTEAESKSPFALVLLAWGATSLDPAGEPDLYRAFRIGSWAEAIRAHALGADQVWIGTRGLMATTTHEEKISLSARRVAAEAERFASVLELDRCRFFDASGSLSIEEKSQFVTLLGEQSDERCYAARGEETRVRRLRAVEDVGASSGASQRMRPLGEDNFLARFMTANGRDPVLQFEAVGDVVPSASEVVVEVAAVGLSQVDVLTEQGLASIESASSGLGCGVDFCGTIQSVGSGVDDLAVGDRVFGVAPGALGRRVCVPRAQVASLPSEIPLEAAAGIAHAQLLARHALLDRARFQSGDRVLIDAGRGAVGHALVQVATSFSGWDAGADVAVFSGSEREVSWQEAYGVRSVDRESQERFDVIIASRSGEALDDLLDRLAPGGRYVDLAPRGRFQLPSLGGLKLGRSASFSSVDAFDLIEGRPGRVQELLSDAADDLPANASRGGRLALFPVASAPRALRYMAQNRNQGRVALDLARVDELSVSPGSTEHTRALAVTGSDCAARSALVDWSDRTGIARVLVPTSDVKPGQLGAWLEEVAGPDASWVHFEGEVATRNDGTRHGIRAAMSEGAGARIFVSCRPGVVGDEVQDRAWETRGMLDEFRRDQESDRWLDLSVGDVGGFEDMLQVCADHLTGISRGDSLVLVGPAERTARSKSPLFSELGESGTSGEATGLSVAEWLALPAHERGASMQAQVVSELASVLGMDEEARDSLEGTMRLDQLGLDSLMTLELFMSLSRHFHLEIRQDWFDSIPTIAEIARTLAERVERAAQAGAR